MRRRSNKGDQSGTRPTPPRIGVVIPSLVVPAWRVELVRRVQQKSPRHQVVLLLKTPKGKQDVEGASALARGLVWMYLRVDRLLFRPASAMPDPLHLVSVDGSFPEMPIFDLDDSTMLRDAEIAGLELVIGDDDGLEEVGRRLPGTIPLLGQTFGGSGNARSASLAAMTAGREVVPCGLMARVPGPGSGTVRASWYASTNRFSLYLTESRVLWRSVARTAQLAAAALEMGLDAAVGGDELVADRVEPAMGGERRTTEISHSGDAMDHLSRGVQLKISFLSVLSLVVRTRLATIKELAKRLTCFDEWVVGVRTVPANAPDLPEAVGGFRKAPVNRHSFLADPFLFQHQGERFLFMEEFVYEKGRGVISCARIADDGTPGMPEIVLTDAGHLSYPFVFSGDVSGGVLSEAPGLKETTQSDSHQKNVFMIPESSESGGVHLYRAEPFPSKWKLVQTLIPDVPAVDTTIIHHDGLYWMFTCIMDANVETTDDLYLLWAERLEGPWSWHPRNPIVSDPRCARCAGAVFRAGHDLVRPSQDGAEHYGKRIRFNRILTLSKTHYREETISSLEAFWPEGARGMHTWNRAAGLEVVDAAIWRSRWRR